MGIDAAQSEFVNQRAAINQTSGEGVRIFHRLLDAHDRNVDTDKPDAIEQLPNRINPMIGERHLDKPRRIYRAKSGDDVLDQRRDRVVALGIPDAEDIVTPGGEHSMSFATRLLLVGEEHNPKLAD